MARPRSEKARVAVLSAMRRAVAEDGYDTVTMEGLAAEAGVAKQTIYRWWPSKAAILGEAMLEGELPAVEIPMTDDLGADLHVWFTEVAAKGATGSNAEFARAMINVTATDHELGAALNERLAAPVRAWVIERMQRATDAGVVRDGLDTVALAEQLLAMATYSSLLGRPMSSDEIDRVVDVLLNGVAR